MRRGRDQALWEFHLVDEVPVCNEEVRIEDLTSALDRVLSKRVDSQFLRGKKRRLQSRKPPDQKPIDDVIVKSLMRLTGVVEDCFTFEHQASLTQRKAVQRQVGRTVRESKAKQLFRKRILEETQARTKQRQMQIERTLETKIRDATAIALANRREENRERTNKTDRMSLDVAEQEFQRIVQFEDDRSRARFERKRIAKKARICQKRRQHRDDVVRSLTELKKGLDKLDSAADAMLNRRFGIKA